MGLAVLPARLLVEKEIIKKHLLQKELCQEEKQSLQQHLPLCNEILQNHSEINSQKR